MSSSDTVDDGRSPLGGGCLCGSVRYTIDFPENHQYPPVVSVQLVMNSPLTGSRECPVNVLSAESGPVR